MATCTGCHVELRLPSRPEFVAVARLAVSAVATRMDFTVDSIEDIKVAVAEACTNAIEHGCADLSDAGMITLRCDLLEDGLAITVEDPGDGFDPNTAARQTSHGTATTATLQERGLGMLLIEALMDEVEFSSNPGLGTVVRMVKRLPIREVEAH